MRKGNHYCGKEKKTGAQCAEHEGPVWVGEVADLSWSRVGRWSVGLLQKLPLEDMKEVKKLAMRTFAERNFQAEVPRP